VPLPDATVALSAARRIRAVGFSATPRPTATATSFTDIPPQTTRSTRGSPTTSSTNGTSPPRTTARATARDELARGEDSDQARRPFWRAAAQLLARLIGEVRRVRGPVASTPREREIPSLKPSSYSPRERERIRPSRRQRHGTVADGTVTLTPGGAATSPSDEIVRRGDRARGLKTPRPSLSVRSSTRTGAAISADATASTASAHREFAPEAHVLASTPAAASFDRRGGITPVTLPSRAKPGGFERTAGCPFRRVMGAKWPRCCCMERCSGHESIGVEVSRRKSLAISLASPLIALAALPRRRQIRAGPGRREARLERRSRRCLTRPRSTGEARGEAADLARLAGASGGADGALRSRFPPQGGGTALPDPGAPAPCRCSSRGVWERGERGR
jgi:hypothetical protein